MKLAIVFEVMIYLWDGHTLMDMNEAINSNSQEASALITKANNMIQPKAGTTSVCPCIAKISGLIACLVVGCFEYRCENVVGSRNSDGSKYNKSGNSSAAAAAAAVVVATAIAVAPEIIVVIMMTMIIVIIIHD